MPSEWLVGGRGVGAGAAALWRLKRTTQGPQVTSPRSGTKCQRNEKSLRGDRAGSLEEKEGTVTWPLREQAGQRGPVSRVGQQAMVRPQENKRSIFLKKGLEPGKKVACPGIR